MRPRPNRRSTAIVTILALCSPQTSLAQTSQSFNFPAQPLQAAVDQLIAASGLVILSQASILEGKTSPPVSGDMTPQQALRQMLSGSGLIIDKIDARNLSIVPAPTHNVVSQNATEDEPFDLGTLVISGELIERTAQDSQTSAVIVTGAEIEARSETRVEDIVNRTPGVEINRNGFRIRGIRQNGPAGIGGGLINTTVDGARVSDLQEVNLAEVSTWDVEQFEILRGPQSTQTGRNALAGAINITTNDPVYDDEVRLRFGYGSFNERQFAFVYNTPIVADRLAFRLAIDKRETEGFLEDTNNAGSEPGAQDLLTARASLRFDVTPDFSAILKYTYNDNSYQPFEVNSETFPDLNVSITGASIVDVEYDTWNLRLEYDLGNNLVLSSETNLNQANGLRRFGDRASGLLDFVTDDRTIDQEFKLLFETERLRGVVGLFYADIESESVTTFVNSIGPFTLENVTDIRSRDVNYAIFGEVEYDLSARSRLIFGARYDVTEFDRDFGFVLSSNAPSPPFPPNSAGVVPTTGSFDAFLPKLGYVYDLTDNATIGLTYQRGYRSGGAAINFGTSIPEPFEFQPEYTDTIELSYRSVSADGRFVLNANAFYTNWQDQQVRVDFPPQPGGIGPNAIIANAGESRLWGFELDTRFEASDALNLYGGIAYANTRFEDFVSAGEDLSGNEFIGAPEWSASVGMDYTFSNGLSVGGDVNYVGRSFSDVQNTAARENDDYFLVNAWARLDFDNGIEMVASVNNLFDESYTTNLRNPIGTPDGLVTPGAPRTISLSLTSTF